MRNNHYAQPGSTFGIRVSDMLNSVPKKTAVGFILIIALVAFEIFNFDTTQYALRNLLGDVRFLGLQWASILAIAFCSIDFAGLIQLFTPETGFNERKEVWYLMGAWLLGATMNAIMTWWAISLTLLNHSFGNEVLSREQLLFYVPIFVAALVWLTRILFIGAFTVAGEHIFEFNDAETPRPTRATASRSRKPNPAPVRAAPKTSQRSRAAAKPRTISSRPTQTNMPTDDENSGPVRRKPVNSRVRQRPPRPSVTRRSPLSGVQARPRSRQSNN